MIPKIIVLNNNDENGGATVAIRRVIKSLIKHTPCEVSMLPYYKITKHPEVVGLFNHKWVANLNRNVRHVYEKLMFLKDEKDPSVRFQFSLANSGLSLHRHPLVISADIIHLNWINKGYLSLEGISRLVALGKPLVWTLQDMWAFTGGCHYAGSCLNYQQNCGNCNFLRNPKSDDLSFKRLSKKAEIFNKANLTLVGTSSWLTECASKSSLFREKRCITIPVPVNTDIYKPLTKSVLRAKFAVPEGKTIVLFGASKLSDKRKGYQYLIDALSKIKNSSIVSPDSIHLLLFGQSNEETLKNEVPLAFTALGTVTGEQNLAEMYNLADVYVMPSLEDNLPNTILEAMACGTPVVAFNTGGIPDMVEHKVTGFLAKLADTDELSILLENLIMNVKVRADMSANCVKKMNGSFSEKSVANQYLDLYKSLMQ